MFSIGILGFIVWSQFSLPEYALVALLSCETQVINIVVSCNCLLLLITVYSQNISRLFLAAGNIISILISSSEIKRDTSFVNFTLFRNLSACLARPQFLLPKLGVIKNSIKEMLILYFIINILAIVLPSLRISPLFLILPRTKPRPLP